jgi:hypothetical protein
MKKEHKKGCKMEKRMDAMEKIMKKVSPKTPKQYKKR